MGRDPFLPKAVFGRLSEKFHTAVTNLVITGLVGLIAIFLDVATPTSFINFGAFTAFMLMSTSQLGSNAITPGVSWTVLGVVVDPTNPVVSDHGGVRFALMT